MRALMDPIKLFFLIRARTRFGFVAWCYTFSMGMIYMARWSRITGIDQLPLLIIQRIHNVVATSALQFHFLALLWYWKDNWQTVKGVGCWCAKCEICEKEHWGCLRNENRYCLGCSHKLILWIIVRVLTQIGKRYERYEKRYKKI